MKTYRVPQRYLRPQVSPKRNYRKIIFLIVLIIGVFLLIQSLWVSKMTSTFPFIDPSVAGIFQSDKKPEEVTVQISLEESIKKALEGTKGTYAVSVKHLKTGESYSQNIDQQFEPASLYKLWVMAVVFQKIQGGELKEDQELSQSVATLNQKFGIDPESAEQKTGVVSYTINEALHQMITISHNYAALLLSEKVKLSIVAKFLKDNNFDKSIVGTDGEIPKTNAADMTSFLEKLYNNEFTNPEYSTKMLDLMKKQRLKNKLPKYLPSEVEIAHKTGELGWFTHDVGIVYTEKGPYIIVVMSESESPKGAEDRIAEVSKAVYSYFSNK